LNCYLTLQWQWVLEFNFFPGNVCVTALTIVQHKKYLLFLLCTVLGSEGFTSEPSAPAVSLFGRLAACSDVISSTSPFFFPFSCLGFDWWLAGGDWCGLGVSTPEVSSLLCYVIRVSVMFTLRSSIVLLLGRALEGCHLRQHRCYCEFAGTRDRATAKFPFGCVACSVSEVWICGSPSRDPAHLPAGACSSSGARAVYR
jgi:hypothetical protein